LGRSRRRIVPCRTGPRGPARALSRRRKGVARAFRTSRALRGPLRADESAAASATGGFFQTDALDSVTDVVAAAAIPEKRRVLPLRNCNLCNARLRGAKTNGLCLDEIRDVCKIPQLSS